MNTFEQDLQEAITYHGHLCSSQIPGICMKRMVIVSLSSLYGQLFVLWLI
jgi:formylmethanofuran dehydrogenase subunit E